jgi:hypothetical protein
VFAMGAHFGPLIFHQDLGHRLNIEVVNIPPDNKKTCKSGNPHTLASYEKNTSNANIKEYHFIMTLRYLNKACISV